MQQQCTNMTESMQKCLSFSAQLKDKKDLKFIQEFYKKDAGHSWQNSHVQSIGFGHRGNFSWAGSESGSAATTHPLQGSYSRPLAEKRLHLDLIPSNRSESYSLWSAATHHTAASHTPLRPHPLPKSHNLTAAAFGHVLLR